ncbi:MAG: 50S ribosomal protein L25 [Planctomycetes bacterium]|nr:50S ribosomal protein L25 [Planctomycetota bacterium]
MAEVINVQLRETRGKRNTHRLRQAGSTPAVLYGHGEATVSLAVPTHEIETAVRHGSRLVDLTGAVTEQALIRELQWDTWGTNVLHVDFTRISADERVEVLVAVELRGEAPGLREGGIVEQLLHSIQIECKATDVPEKLAVNINHLGLHGTITAAELPFPEGATLGCGLDTVVVQCVEPVAELDEDAEGAGEVEPEVIGRKPEEEGEN